MDCIDDELAPETPADCESVAARDVGEGEIAEGTVALGAETLEIPDGAGVLDPTGGTKKDAEVVWLAMGAEPLGLAAAAMLKSPLVANT